MYRKEAVLFEAVYHQIMALLAKKLKIEVVGLCFGNHIKERTELRSFVTTPNLDNSAISFSLDYEVMYREIQRHEEKREILVGIFHSHPIGEKLYPSQKDYYFMRYWPDPFLWLIGGCEREGTDSQLEIFSLLDKKIINIPYIITRV